MNENTIKKVLAQCGKLSVSADTLQSDSDLYEAGLTSLTTVNVMLALEDAFDVEFEDAMLTRKTFQSIDALADAIGQLQE